MNSEKTITLRTPTLQDGMDVFELVGQCPPLDPNSSYCNLLQCGHFADTSVAAELNGELVGFISGYRVPQRQNTLFIWQVAVSDKARGQGLASRMLANIVARSNCQDIEFMETTITEDNRASWALFEGFAKRMGTECQSNIWLDKDQHFKGQHDSEALLRIGPFKPTEQLS